MITLYHGSGEPVPNPLAKVGRRNLDFGRGFYLTKYLIRLFHGQKSCPAEREEV